MAEVNLESYHEALMSVELSRFWSTMNRKFERERPQLPLFSPRLPIHSQLHGLVTSEHQPDNGQNTFLTETPTKPQDEVPIFEDEIGVVGVEELTTPKDLSGSNSDDRSDVCVVEGARVGDVPASFVVRGLRTYERPVVGTYIDPSIVSGFCYHVCQLDSAKLLFKGRALRLAALGRGYGKRITFVGDSHNTNENYFWSDTHPEGYGFSLSLVQEGDKFTLKDANNFPVATAEVNKILEPQEEVDHRVNKMGGVEKRAHVGLVCRVSYFDPACQVQLLIVKGVAQAVKAKGSGSQAVLKKIVDCNVGGERGWTLVAGADRSARVSVVSGDKIGDIPTKYSIKGLLPHELPVIGTYVDSRIVTGFRYRVRPADSRRPLFHGAALLLQGLGRGYGKRLTFASDNLNNNENYFWSDTNPEGYGFSIQVVSPGDDFRISSSCGEDLGRARVFRADLPQVEDSTSISPEGHITKRVRVTLTCDLSFHGDEDDHTLVVTGTAVVVRRRRVASVLRLEEVALGSHISVFFRHTSKQLLFVRE